MSRKDYIAVAAVVRSANLSDEQRFDLALGLAELFAGDNPRFWPDLFVTAATGKENI